jgi:hypothetical protein
MKSIIRIAGVILMFMITINFYIILFVAMMHNGTAFVHFNHFNEGLIEYIIYMILLPIIIVSFVLNLRTYKRRRYEVNAQEIHVGNTKKCIRDNPPK